MIKTTILGFSNFFNANSPADSKLVSAEAKNDIDIARKQVISLEEVSWHDNAHDCWLVIYDRVYDVTEFLEEHPGGHDIILEYAGRDASWAFRGSGHSSLALKALDAFLVGYLPPNECVFRKEGGYNK